MATLWISRRDCEEGALPCRCLKCGQKATGFVEQDFFGTQLWTSPVSFLISLMGGWESVRLRVPMCESHRHHWRNRRLMLCGLSIACVVGGGVVFAVCLLLSDDVVRLLGNAMLVISLLVCFGAGIFMLLLADGRASIRALEVHEDGVRLTNVHPDAVHQGDKDAPLGQLLHDGTLSKFDPERPRWLDRTRGESQ
jgi:hypothetical protein